MSDLLQSGEAFMYYKVGQVLLHSGATRLCYKQEQFLLQIGAGITKRGNFYYKMAKVLQSGRIMRKKGNRTVVFLKLALN